ncbi:MAG: hypothetical protein O3B47_02605 [bacterium]|nr:hypothetical protein [bacterium]
MLKKISLIVVSVFLIGCTQVQPTDNETADFIPQDDCLSNSDLIKQSECYFQLAMENKDQNICKSIKFSSVEEIKEYINSNQIEDHGYYDHLSIGRCKNEIEYSFEDANWKLESGTPPWAEQRLVYMGEAQLSGWIVYQSAYVGEPEAHFHVADEDLLKLPPSLQSRQDYLLMSDISEWTRVQEGVIKSIESRSEAGTVEIIVNKASIAIEGSPALGFVTMDN